MEPNLENHTADLSISNPPFGNKRFSVEEKQEISRIYPTDIGFELSSLFVELMLSKTKSNGKVIAVVSDEFLFSKKSLNFRKHLVQEDVLDEVIALPMGLYAPYTMIGSNVLFFKNKNKKDSFGFYNGRDTIKNFIKDKRPSFTDSEITSFIDAPPCVVREA